MHGRRSRDAADDGKSTLFSSLPVRRANTSQIFVGTLAGKFSDATSSGASDSFNQAVSGQALNLVYIGASQLVALSAGIYSLNHVGERITLRLRREFLDAVLRQNVAFFDSHGAGEIAVSITNDINLAQDGVSQKVGLIALGIGGFVSALVVSFVTFWQLALVLLCLPVVIIVVMGGLGGNVKRFQGKSTTGFAMSGTVAEEVISCIRNVTAFGSQHLMLRKYEASLSEPAKHDFLAKFLMGLAIAIMMFIVNASHGLAVGYPRLRTSS